MTYFADETTITVSAGNGGNGCVAFRREKYIPMGGPSGGDGGRGGDVIFEVRRNLRTLVHLRYAHNFKAKSGHDGMGRNMHGSDGEDAIVPVPPGTVIKDAKTGEILKDFGKSRRRALGVPARRQRRLGQRAFQIEHEPGTTDRAAWQARTDR